MRLHEITKTHARPTARRVGRGISAGGGKTAGRGTKGQKARTGANSNVPRTFEGGATGFIQRLPKLKGFKSRMIKPVTLRIDRVAALFEADEKVTIASLVEKNLIKPKEAKNGVKIVGGPEAVEFKFTIDSEDPKITTSKSLQKNA